MEKFKNKNKNKNKNKHYCYQIEVSTGNKYICYTKEFNFNELVDMIKNHNNIDTILVFVDNDGDKIAVKVSNIITIITVNEYTF